MKIKVFEAFAGYGSQRMALENIGIEHEVVAISEIDKFAIASYEEIHGEVNNLGDISKIDVEDVPDHDLFTYSFPCQDISVAGKGKGFDKDSGTRSGLLWECQRIIEKKKPKYLLMENVKNLISDKFMAGFNEWIEYLENLGYSSYWDVLNAKDFGVPQNRERVFMISILGEHDPYVFPEPIELKLRLKDILESKVDEKYYLDSERTNKLKLQYKDIENNEYQASRIGGIYDKENKRHQAGSVYDKLGISPTLDTAQGGWRQPSITEEGATLRVRKLTPLEYWRLMGVKDEYFHRVEKVNSNSQLYKQAGNSIVVPVLEAIFRNMFLRS